MEMLIAQFICNHFFLIYHQLTSSMSDSKDLVLYDGDRVAVLITWFINKTLGQVKLDGKPLLTSNKEKIEGKYECKFIQTAYANGASQTFLR